MTKKTKEAIKTSAVIVLVVAIVLVFWVFPLNQAGKIVSRDDGDTITVAPDKFGPAADTMIFVTEDNISLAGYLIPASSESPSAEVLGTVILVHGLFAGAGSQSPKAQALATAGYNVVVYDQRAFGGSGGDYRSGGYYEANDLQSVISKLDLLERLKRPLVIWGEDHGAAAALRAWATDNRIDRVIAENPVIDGRDWQERVVRHKNLWAPDVYLPVLWWWMKQKSSYEINVDETDISDYFGIATERPEGGLLVIAPGNDGVPDNPDLAELQSFGGEWLVLPPVENGLFAAYRDQIMEKVLNPSQPGE